MKYLFICSFFFVFAFFGNELGFTATSTWWTHITYSFQHADIVHLLINSVSFFFLYKALQAFYQPYKIAVFIVVSAWLCSLPLAYDKVVVGASAMIYAMLGVYFYLVAAKQIVYRNKNAELVFFLSLFTFIVVGIFKSNTAGLLHIISLVSGVSTGFFYNFLTNKFKL